MHGYRAPRWLVGAHAQTIWSALGAPRERVDYRRERWLTPDGDFVDVDFAGSPGAPRQEQGEGAATVRDERPLVVVFHGLEGCSRSHYAVAAMAAALERGWRGAVVHFRGCSGELNRAPRAYHSGDSDEIDWILRRMRAGPARGSALFALGVSLGGNALLKWLGERAGDARFVTAAAAVSAPHDLQAGAESLARGFSRVYTANFMRSLKRKSVAKLAQYPGLFDRERMLASTSFFEFDDAVTAPMHGFRSCYDYWSRSSCGGFLGGIEVPTLVLNALNDPFQPAASLTPARRASRLVRLEYPPEGGHVGFLAGRFPGHSRLLPERLMEFFASQLAPDAGRVGSAARTDAPAPEVAAKDRDDAGG